VPKPLNLSSIFSFACGRNRNGFCVVAALLAACPAHASESRLTEPLEEIVVTASLRPAPASEFPSSTTVLDADVLQSAGLQHLQDVLGLVPNLNWSGGTSRPRYFQLRGWASSSSTRGRPTRRSGS